MVKALAREEAKEVVENTQKKCLELLLLTEQEKRDNCRENRMQTVWRRVCAHMEKFEGWREGQEGQAEVMGEVSR